MANKLKASARALQEAFPGWTYHGCRNVLLKHGGNYDAARAEIADKARLGALIVEIRQP